MATCQFNVFKHRDDDSIYLPFRGLQEELLHASPIVLQAHQPCRLPPLSINVHLAAILTQTLIQQVNC